MLGGAIAGYKGNSSVKHADENLRFLLFSV